MDATFAVNSFIERILTEVVPRHFLDISNDDSKEYTNNFNLQNSTLKNAGPHNQGLESNNFPSVKESSLDKLDDLINNCLDSVAFGVNKPLSPNILSKCLQMGGGYQDQNYLKRAMLVPVLEIPFMCSICGLEFENKIQITDHITMHKDDQVNYTRVDLLESVENSFCNNTAFNKNNGMVPKIDIIPLVSTESTPIISTKNAVNTAEIKLKENECSECGKKFSSSYGLKRHKLHHADVKPFTCKVCGKGFTERSKLKRHLYIHAGIRPFECSTCGSTFTEKNRLTHHMATHSEQKHFKCSECEKLFSTEYSLKRHKIIHEDNRKVQSQLLNNKSITIQTL